VREVFNDVVEELGWDAFGERGGGGVGFGGRSREAELGLEVVSRGNGGGREWFRYSLRLQEDAMVSAFRAEEIRGRTAKRREFKVELTLIKIQLPSPSFSSQIPALIPELSLSLIQIPLASFRAARQRKSMTNDRARSSRSSAVASWCLR
jgi:hypothetical protein